MSLFLFYRYIHLYYFSYFTCKWYHRVIVSVWHFTEHNILWIHPLCCTWQYFILFKVTFDSPKIKTWRHWLVDWSSQSVLNIFNHLCNWTLLPANSSPQNGNKHYHRKPEAIRISVQHKAWLRVRCLCQLLHTPHSALGCEHQLLWTILFSYPLNREVMLSLNHQRSMNRKKCYQLWHLIYSLTRGLPLGMSNNSTPSWLVLNEPLTSPLSKYISQHWSREIKGAFEMWNLAHAVLKMMTKESFMHLHLRDRLGQ